MSTDIQYQIRYLNAMIGMLADKTSSVVMFRRDISRLRDLLVDLSGTPDVDKALTEDFAAAIKTAENGTCRVCSCSPDAIKENMDAQETP